MDRIEAVDEASVTDTKALRVLLVHNTYQHRGGEDTVFESERLMLASRGHAIETYERRNDDIAAASRVALLRDTFWSRRTVQEVGVLLEHFRPDVVHVHNTFPLVSPSLYAAARAHCVPVVQTLHNFRLLCPQAMLLRQGRVCEDCVGKTPWRAVVHRCYRDSATQSAALAGMLQFHRWRGTFDRDVTLYIALNAFCRDKFVEGGLPAERIRVKPNFIRDPGPPAWDEPREGLLFVGRLSPEKGVDTLLDAVTRRVGSAPVRLAGAGPMHPRVAAVSGVRALGSLKSAQVLARMRQALALVLPSICFDSFPMTLVEAFASGTPVIASRLGALQQLVEDGVTGLLFQPGNAADLAAKLDWAEHHPEAMQRMGRAARAQYEQAWGEEVNHRILTSIYDEALALGGRLHP